MTTRKVHSADYAQAEKFAECVTIDVFISSMKAMLEARDGGTLNIISAIKHSYEIATGEEMTGGTALVIYRMANGDGASVFGG